LVCSGILRAGSEQNLVIVFHSVFSLVIRSNYPVPGLPLTSEIRVAPDLELFLNVDPRIGGTIPAALEDIVYISTYTDNDGQPALRISKSADGEFLHMEYSDGVQFWLDRQGTRVWATWNAPLLVEDVATYLLGPVLGLVLRLRGVCCLHASAIALDNRAVAFVGSEGSGKSTTAAALARRNHPVISDDVVALAESENGFLVSPAYPYLSLWSDSTEMLFGHADALPGFSPHYAKKQLLLGDANLAFAARPLPLGAIFLLADRRAEADAPFIEPVTPRQSMLRLVADSYATNLLDSSMRAREFELLGRLLAVVPVYRLHAHQLPSRIDSLCDLVERHCRMLGVSQSQPH
jgi:hypothetical protein